jgi:hypothetical protein
VGSRPDIGDDDDIPTDVHVIKVHLKRVIRDHAETEARLDTTAGHILRIEAKVDAVVTKIDTSIRTVKTTLWIGGGLLTLGMAIGGAIAWGLVNLALRR